MQSFQSSGNPLRFCNLVAIQFNREDCGQDCRPDVLGRLFGGQVWVGSSLIATWDNPGPICGIWLQS